MTISLTASRHIAMFATVVAVGLAPAGTIGAQGGPPAARAPRDSQPVLQAPRPPSAPPSSVTPRPRAVRQLEPTTVDTTRTRIKRVSAPPDSARPAPAPLAALDPRRAPSVQSPPPAPRAAGAAQPVAQRALQVSDQPPANATARCKDGTFLTTPVDDNSCSDHGGLTVRVPQRQAPPPRPRP